LNPACLLARALDEKRQRAMSRLFKLLALVHPPSDIAAVTAALAAGEARQRSSAVEYLDNLLSGDLRRRVLLLVDDMPLDERVRKGNVLYKTRPRDIEDTVAQLVHDDNQVIAAAAMHLVEERRMWTLADDLEHVLTHRDARDWYAFEAASWALAASRMPAERRRQLWQEPLPAVELADRLRRLAIFDFTSVDELFRIAELGQQIRHEQGRVVYERGTPPATLQFVLDGRVEIAADGDERVQQGAPAPLAFEEVLEGRPIRTTVRALEATICLSITADRFLSLLAENVQLAQGIFRWLTDTRTGLVDQILVRGDLTAEARRKIAAGLQAVDRVLLLQESPLVKGASGAQLLRLAAIARPVTFKKGQSPMSGSVDQAMLVVLSGLVTVSEPEGPPLHTDVGDVIGIYQAFGGKPLAATLVAESDGTALRFLRRDLFDVLADDTALLQTIFSNLLQVAGRAEARRVGVETATE
jgi:CRP-like cAMP-binding protein